MAHITLEHVNENVEALKQVINAIQMKLDILIDNEDLTEIEPAKMSELSDEVIAEIEESKRKPKNSFISHEDVMAEFG
jgi:hypothetical protein